jgi:Holliday junction resolvasome RuvABC endonuclease subunit
MMAARPSFLTLAIHPTSRGFGWVAFEGPFAPHDWANVDIKKGDKNAISIRAVEAILDRLTPETLVLEAFEKQQSSRSDRIARLCRAIVGLASSRGIYVEIYERADIQACFRTVGATTRQEIAEAVARQVTVFHHTVPRKRQLWDSEDKRMALFSAAALVLTHYHAGMNELFEGMQSGA